jgi:hypothetical protein
LHRSPAAWRNDAFETQPQPHPVVREGELHRPPSQRLGLAVEQELRDRSACNRARGKQSHIKISQFLAMIEELGLKMETDPAPRSITAGASGSPARSIASPKFPKLVGRSHLPLRSSLTPRTR